MNYKTSAWAAIPKKYYFGITVFLAFALILAGGAVSQVPVDLGTAANYVALAKSGITTAGSTYITGNIAVSPIAATAITGFGLVMDASGVFSKSTYVTGKVYASNYTAPTPSVLTTAVSDMEAAYTNAANRVPPNYTELFAGDITGQTLAPGIYKWTTGVLISDGGVIISGSPSDVWIFQVGSGLTVANNAIVSLSGGAQASNIFWQVAGQTTIGTNVVMEGIILCYTAIVINSGAQLNGKALAQTAITFEENTTLLPIELTSFSAHRNAQVITLKWKTVSEQNSFGFDIERRLDGSEWETIGFVDAAGTSNAPRYYSFNDDKFGAFKGVQVASYKLYQLDRDGSGVFSATIDVHLDKGISALELGLYPNPAHASTNIFYMNPSDQNITITIHDMLGREIARPTDNKFVSAGSYSVPLSVNKLVPGMYFIRLSTATHTVTTRMTRVAF